MEIQSILEGWHRRRICGVLIRYEPGLSLNSINGAIGHHATRYEIRWPSPILSDRGHRSQGGFESAYHKRPNELGKFGNESLSGDTRESLGLYCCDTQSHCYLGDLLCDRQNRGSAFNCADCEQYSTTIDRNPYFHDDPPQRWHRTPGTSY